MNGNIHTRCPKAVYLESLDARFFVNTYQQCKAMNIYPHPGGINVQTAFTAELFDFLDHLTTEQKAKSKPADDKA